MRLDLQIDREIDSLISTFNDSPRKNQVAINRALRKLSRWTERRVYRDVATQIGVTQKIIKELNRVSVRLFNPPGQSKDFSLIIWVGTYDIAAHKLGKPIQTQSGVRTGKHTWDGAFLMQPLNAPYPFVFKRTANWKHKFQRSRVSGRMMYIGLPIEKQSLPIFSMAHQVLEKIKPELLERFATLLQQELNYAFQIQS